MRTYQESASARWGDDIAFYFGAIGVGWHEILFDLFVDLDSLGVLDDNVFDVKEKYGVLRAYLRESTTEAERPIDIAASRSSKTCEDCGAVGRRRSGGWIKTRCDSCAAASAKKAADSWKT